MVGRQRALELPRSFLIEKGASVKHLLSVSFFKLTTGNVLTS